MKMKGGDANEEPRGPRYVGRTIANHTGCTVVMIVTSGHQKDTQTGFLRY
jgi:hypothetical protein